MRLGFELLSKFKQESSQLRNEIDSLMNQLIKKVEDVHGEVKPEIYGDYKQLKNDIRQQRHDKEILLKNIDTLKKQTDVQKEKVAFCDQRVQEMETQVGMIAHTKCYKEGFEIPPTEKPTLEKLVTDTFMPKNSVMSSARLNAKSSQDELRPAAVLPRQHHNTEHE